MLCRATSLPVGVGLAPKINIASRLFTKIKLCWTGLIITWVIIWQISRAVFLWELGCRSVHQSRLPPQLKNVVRGLNISPPNLTSRNSSVYSDFLPRQNRLSQYLVWLRGHKFIGYWQLLRTTLSNLSLYPILLRRLAVYMPNVAIHIKWRHSTRSDNTL